MKFLLCKLFGHKMKPFTYYVTYQHADGKHEKIKKNYLCCERCELVEKDND